MVPLEQFGPMLARLVAIRQTVEKLQAVERQ
jgi:hypothetical protein